MELPAATPEERAQNVRDAIGCYREALGIYRKDHYPVDYAGIQNNLGAAYMELPAATPEERARKVTEAIACFREALGICRKDQYPRFYCQTAANLGMALLEIRDPEACRWLKEGYSLREYLPDQGRRLEPLIEEACKGR